MGYDYVLYPQPIYEVQESHRENIGSYDAVVKRACRHDGGVSGRVEGGVRGAVFAIG